LGCLKLHILEQQDKRTELKVSYRNKELTLKNTVLKERRETLINYTDPTGMTVEPPVNGLDWFADDTGQYFWNEKKGSYEHYSPEDGSFQGYYTANEFSEPVGDDYSIIFDLSNMAPDDEFNPEHTLKSAVIHLMAALEMADGNPFNESEFKNISDPNLYPGVLILEHPEMSGGITLGNFIIVGSGSTKSLRDHEYGHYLDFKFHFNYDKAAYSKEIGLPSLWSATKATIRGDRSHSSSSTERRADILGGEWAKRNH